MSAPARPDPTDDTVTTATGPSPTDRSASAGRRPLRLDPVEFDACWELLGLGEPPLTLRLPSPGRSWAERHQVLTGVLARLDRRGLVERSAPGPAVAGPLRLLARADHQLDLRLSTPDGPLVGIGAVAGERGVRVLRLGDELRVQPIRPGQLVSAMVELVGPMRAGAGRPVNLAASVFDAAHAATTDGKLWTMADELVALGVDRQDAASWVRMCSGIRSVGQLGSAHRPDGLPRFGPWVIGFQRTDDGDFLQLRRPGPHGPTVSVCPLDAGHLTRLATELLSATLA